MRYLVLSLLCASCISVAYTLPRWGTNQHIIGGNVTDITEIPYQAALEVNIPGFVGLLGAATIYTERLLITAGHATGFEPSTLTIRVGTNYLETGGIVHTVESIIPHPKFDLETSLDYDIGVIIVNEPLVFTVAVQPIVLADSEPLGGEAAVASGWGNDSEGGNPTELLNSVNVRIVSRTDCQAAYDSRNETITTRMVCSGEPGHSTCQGDSGGPLTVGGKLVGIVSWANGCAREGYPTVFANVNDVEIREFIQTWADQTKRAF